MNPTRVIVNPVSGKGRGGRIAEQVSRTLHDRGLPNDVHYSRSAADVTELARAAVRDRCALVVGVGGDGLVNVVGNELVGTETALGIIPVGVGNDIARGLGIPFDVEQACAVLAQGCRRHLDVGRANGRYFFSIAIMGFAAEINRRANQFQRLRFNALYTALTVATAFTYNPLSFSVTYQGQERRCYSWLVAVGNTRSCGRGMALVPGARPDDGVLDACLVNGMGRFELLYVFTRVFRGTHVYHTGVETVRGQEIVVQTDAPCDLYADGERFGPLPAIFTAIPQALRVVVPEQNT